MRTIRRRHRSERFRSTPRVDDHYDMQRFTIIGVVVAVLASAGVCLVVFQPSTSLNTCAPGRMAILNRSSAIATLRYVLSAQSQCQASGVIDTNNNGQGEYGYFGELSGRTAIRGSTQSITPPVLSAAFGNIAAARVGRSGYYFQMFLPSPTAAGIAEDEAGGDVTNDNGVDPGHAEVLWCCYAWPSTAGNSGNRTFFINQTGDVLATNGAIVQYSNTVPTVPTFDVAFIATASASMTGQLAANTVGRDANTWVVVQ